MRLVNVLACLALVLPATAADLRWIPPTTAGMEIDGLPWFERNGGDFYRLPKSLEKQFPPAVWKLSKSPSGGRIRFRTDSTALAIRVEYPGAPDMKNMHAFGQTGVDLYADGAYVNT